jgi:protoheme ferro-lyase
MNAWIILNWVFLSVFSVLGGIFFLNYLTVHPLKMSLYLFLTCLTIFVVVLLILYSFQNNIFFIVIPIALGFFLVGYLVSNAVFLSREDARPLPVLTRQPGDLGDGHMAVIYFTHGEPQTYDPIGWINQFRELDKEHIAFVPFFARPFFAYYLRDHYLQVGMSQHRLGHLRMMKALEQEFRRAGDTTTRFYICFLDDSPSPNAAVIQALNDGASHLIVSEVFLTISNHTDEGESIIKKVNVEKYGATLRFTGPLWDSKTLKSMFVQRVDRNLGAIDKSEVGILLVGHGQPEEWDKLWPTETQQEVSFRQDILKLFEQEGFRSENLSEAWMEFKKPHADSVVKKFYKNGVRKIFFFAAAISADSIQSQYDIPADIQKAKLSADVQVVNLGGWNDDPIVIQAIKEKIDPFMIQ